MLAIMAHEAQPESPRRNEGLNAHDLRIKMTSYRLHAIAVDCSEELFECFDLGAHIFIRPYLRILQQIVSPQPDST